MSTRFAPSLSAPLQIPCKTAKMSTPMNYIVSEGFWGLHSTGKMPNHLSSHRPGVQIKVPIFCCQSLCSKFCTCAASVRRPMAMISMNPGTVATHLLHVLATCGSPGPCRVSPFDFFHSREMCIQGFSVAFLATVTPANFCCCCQHCSRSAGASQVCRSAKRSWQRSDALPQALGLRQDPRRLQRSRLPPTSSQPVRPCATLVVLKKKPVRS